MTEIGSFVDAQGYFRVKHTARWVSHDLFELKSDVMVQTIPADLLGWMSGNGVHMEFENERPARRSVWSVVRRALFP